MLFLVDSSLGLVAGNNETGNGQKCFHEKSTYFSKAKTFWQAAWPSGLGRWRCNPEVPGSKPPPCH